MPVGSFSRGPGFLEFLHSLESGNPVQIERGTRTLQRPAGRPCLKRSAKRALYTLDSRPCSSQGQAPRGNGGMWGAVGVTRSLRFSQAAGRSRRIQQRQAQNAPPAALRPEHPSSPHKSGASLRYARPAKNGVARTRHSPPLRSPLHCNRAHAGPYCASAPPGRDCARAIRSDSRRASSGDSA